MLVKQSILLIEDDPNITDFMEVVLDQQRYQLTIARTGMEALTAFQTTTIDLVLTRFRTYLILMVLIY
jgi:two-component system KDP operon response regulator KdpE